MAVSAIFWTKRSWAASVLAIEHRSRGIQKIMGYSKSSLRRLSQLPRPEASYSIRAVDTEAPPFPLGFCSCRSGQALASTWHRTKRKLLRWSVGHRRDPRERVVTSPGPSHLTLDGPGHFHVGSGAIST